MKKTTTTISLYVRNDRLAVDTVEDYQELVCDLSNGGNCNDLECPVA